MMMLGPDRHKMIQLVVGKLTGKPDEAPSNVAEDNTPGKEAAVKKLFDAMKAGDVKAGMAALEAWFTIRESEPHEEAEHEEPGEAE